ncbi:MAG TPA: TadE/TadG family type IV pilus assembly protein [Gemmataceae bacterium]|nr:TadE/TadG family type IV pilus assembly protein [Gemmataceae bacterium]
MGFRVRYDRRRGVTIVEMAFVLSFALLFLFGILEYGRYLMVLHTTNNAAREGARYAIVHTGDGTTLSQVIAVVNSKMAGVDSQIQGCTVNVFSADPTGIYNSSSGTAIYPPTIQAVSGSSWNSASFGSPIVVQITGTYQPILPSFLFMNSNMSIQASAMMNSEAN